MAQQSMNPNLQLPSLQPPSLIPEMMLAGGVSTSPPQSNSMSGPMGMMSSSSSYSSARAQGQSVLGELPGEEKLVMRGGLRGAEGPRTASQTGLLSSVHAATNANTASLMGSRLDSSHMMGGGAAAPPYPGSSGGGGLPTSSHLHSLVSGGRSGGGGSQYYSEETLEMLSAEMSFSALYMHELHQRRRRNQIYESLQDNQAASLWQTADHPETPGPAHGPADIQMGLLPRPPAATNIQMGSLAQRLSPQREEEEEINDADSTPGNEHAPLLMCNSP